MVYVGCSSACGQATGVGVGELYAINPAKHTAAAAAAGGGRGEVNTTPVH